MAWRNNARLSHKQLKGMFRKWREPIPDLTPGGIVPRSVMRQIQRERLPADAINARLQQLLAAYHNGG